MTVLSTSERCQRDRLALAVRVGGHVDRGRLLSRALQLFEDRALALDDDVLRREVVVDVDAELTLGEILDVAHGGLDLVGPGQDLAECSGLCR